MVLDARAALPATAIVTSSPLTTRIVSHCPSARDAALVKRYLTLLMSACSKLLKEFRHNETYVQIYLQTQLKV